MALALRLVSALASLVILLLIIAAGTAAFALGTETGREMLRQQTAALADELLGAGHSLQVGAQTLAIDGLGLAVSFRDVEIKDASGARMVAAAKISAGLELSAVLNGEIDFDRLEIGGLTVEAERFSEWVDMDDRLSDPAVRWNLARAADDALARMDRQALQLRWLGIETIQLTDAVLRTPAGNVTVEAKLDESDGSYALDARAELGEAAWRLTAEAGLHPRHETIRTLSAEWRSHLPRSFERALGWNKYVDLPTDASVSLALASAVDLSPRRLELTLRSEAFRVGSREKALELSELGLTLGHTEGTADLAITDGFISAPQVHAGFSGGVTFEADGNYAYQLSTDDLRSSVGSVKAEERRAHLVLAGTGDLGARSVQLDRVAVTSGEGKLTGAGGIDYSGPSGDVKLALDGEGLDAGAVKAFWPSMIAPAARKWLVENAGDRGMVEHGRIWIGLEFARLIELLDPKNKPTEDELRIDLTVAGADLATVGDLPGITDASGTIEVNGPRTVVGFRSARLVGFPEVVVEPSSIEFLAQAPPFLNVMLSLEMAGPVGDLLAIADREPIGAIEKLAIRPENGQGRAELSIGASFVLGDGVVPGQEMKGWSLIADLDDAGLDQPVEGRMLSGFTGTISVSPGLAVGSLDGAVDAIAATVDFSFPFQPLPMGDKSLIVKLRLRPEDTAKHLPVSSDLISGAVEATIERDAEGTSVSVDLTQARLGLPWIGWSKGAGIPAALSFDLSDDASNETELRDVLLEGEGFDAQGTVSLDEQGVRTVDLERVALNSADSANLRVRRAQNGYAIRLGGERIDARSLLDALRRGSPADEAAKEPSDSAPTVDLSVAFDSVAGFGGEELSDFSLNYSGQASEIAALSFTATTRSGAAVDADVSPRAGRTAVSLTTRDAGALLRFAGLYERLEGGALTLDLRGTRAGGYGGTLRLRDFALVDEPRLERLVGSRPDPASRSLGEAIGAEIETNRASFDSAEVQLGYRDGALRINDGIIRGPIFGSSFEGVIDNNRDRLSIAGSFMPAYGINRVFGAIPLFGQILGNGNEGGLIGITYQLAGAFAEPTLTVNPISAIAPGIFRRIFSYE